jgi:hypothetical protein
MLVALPFYTHTVTVQSAQIGKEEHRSRRNVKLERKYLAIFPLQSNLKEDSKKTNIDDRG